MHVYGHDSLQVAYAADCSDGEVVISAEHSAARWIDPQAYRDGFSDELIARMSQSDARVARMFENIRDMIDAYLRWRALRDAAARVR